jgi:flagellar hook protein FlgE
MGMNIINTGITGMRAHNTWLDIIGNNIANMNTPGFKRSRPHFASLIEVDALSCGGGSVGTGVRVNSVDRIFTQGPVTQTSRPLDLALQGEGFFALKASNNQEVYTRDGAFDFDKTGTLRHIGSNAAVLGTNSQPITAPNNLIDPPVATTEVDIVGNFDPTQTGPVAEVLATAAPFQTKTGAPAAAGTSLNDLSANAKNYTDGDTISLTGRDADGNDLSSIFTFGNDVNLHNGTTLGTLVNFINGTGTGPGSSGDKFPGSTLALDANGNLSFTSDTTGDADLQLAFEDGLTKSDGSPQAGSSNFEIHGLNVATEGADPFSFNTAIEVFDAKGLPRQLNLEFTRVVSTNPGNPVWDMTASIAGAVFTDNVVQGIRFNKDGSFNAVTGLGNGDPNVTFQIPNCPPVTINLDFGTSGGFNGATQFGGFNDAVAKSQNGLPVGHFQGFDFDGSGNLIVNFTNGNTQNRGQLKVVTFPNQEGLKALGDNLFQKTPDTGQPMQGVLQSGATTVLQHYLENSNVDQAQELTSMIIAQNGFAANARSISTGQQLFDTALSLVR